MGWIERWARRAAAPVQAASDSPGQVEQTPPARAPHSSRRDFLRRAALVGGAAWAVPTMQSVTAPAAAASGDCSQGTCGTGVGCSLCPTDHTCGVNAECITNRCTNGTCAPSNAGGACLTAADCTTQNCQSGTCGQNAAGGVCAANGDCISGNCSGGFCQPGGIGATCVTTADCSAGQCFARSGGPATCGGPGSPCSTNGGCTNGNCNGATCGGWIAGCDTNADCATGRTCFLGWVCL